MATTQTKQQNKTNQAKTPFTMPLINGGQNAFFTMLHMQSAFIQSVARCNLEALKFVQQRVEKDLELAGNMGSCKTFDEFQNSASTFYQTAFDDYSEEAETLASLTAGLAAETLEKVQTEAAKAAPTQN